MCADVTRADCENELAGIWFDSNVSCTDVVCAAPSTTTIGPDPAPQPTGITAPPPSPTFGNPDPAPPPTTTPSPTAETLGATSPVSLVVVPPPLAAYAHTLCRVLHACGDGDESTCLAGNVAHCATLRCCSVIGVA